VGGAWSCVTILPVRPTRHMQMSHVPPLELACQMIEALAASGGRGRILSLFTAVGYGAVGGLIIEAVDVWRWLQAWQQARHAALADGKPLPAFTRFIDPYSDSAVALTRAVLGGVAGLLLHSEVVGTYAAVTVGASAPALLAALGKATTPAEALQARPGSPG
jgi:hypothetical protein